VVGVPPDQVGSGPFLDYTAQTASAETEKPVDTMAVFGRTATASLSAQGTVLHQHYRIAFRYRVYDDVDVLDAYLQAWLPPFPAVRFGTERCVLSISFEANRVSRISTTELTGSEFGVTVRRDVSRRAA